MSTDYLVAISNTLLAVFTLVPGTVISLIITTDSVGVINVYLIFLGFNRVISPGLELNRTSEPKTIT